MLTRDMIENVVRSTYLARVREDANAAASAFSDQATLQVSAATIPGFGEPIKGREAIRQALINFANTLRYEDWKELALVVEGNKAAIRWQAKITASKPAARMSSTVSILSSSMAIGSLPFITLSIPERLPGSLAGCQTRPDFRGNKTSARPSQAASAASSSEIASMASAGACGSRCTAWTSSRPA